METVRTAGRLGASEWVFVCFAFVGAGGRGVVAVDDLRLGTGRGGDGAGEGDSTIT